MSKSLLQELDEHRKTLAEARTLFAADGKITPQEESQLAEIEEMIARAAGAAAGTGAGAGGGFIAATVGKGAKNDPADVEKVQQALVDRAGAKLKVDGEYGPKLQQAIEEFQQSLGQFKPDGVVAPGRGAARVLSGVAAMPKTPERPNPVPPPELGVAALDKGAAVWHSTRGILETNIEELKKGVRAFYGAESDELLRQIDENMVKLGSVLDTLDTRLAESLDAANGAAEGKARTTELKKSQGIMKEYILYVNSEPLIQHMDDNPFGVTTSLKRIIGDALKHLAQLFAKQASGK
ncbi:MAG: peptidoglycan-binding domain-containing protein [Lacipirellulaceae bacterium]